MLRDRSYAGLQRAIEEIAEELPGRMGAAVHFLDTGEVAGIRQDELFPSASVIKIPIAVEVLRQAEVGLLQLEDPVPLIDAERSAGSGMLAYLHSGLDLTVRDALELMIAISDNTATNLLLRRIGGAAVVNATMDALGLPSTRSAGPIGRPNPPRDWREWSRTTPAEMTRLLAGIASDRVVSESASSTLLGIMRHQQFGEMLPRYLPIMEDTSEGHHPRVSVAHKTGGLDHARSDAGIISLTQEGREWRVAVSVFTAEVHDANLWTVENVAVRAVARVGEAAFRVLEVLAGEPS